MSSVGHQLMQARKARTLTIEDVAFETRIPPQRLRDMENDDLSNFANLTYAKGFLKLYSKYLALDLSDYLDGFDTSAIPEATGHEYSVLRRRNEPAAPLPVYQSPAQPVMAGWRSAAALTAVLAAGSWIALKNWSSPDSPPPERPVAAINPAPAAAPTPPPILARVERSGRALPSTPPAAPPVSAVLSEAPGSPPTPKQIRRATVVDDDGNEIAPPRPVAPRS